MNALRRSLAAVLLLALPPAPLASQGSTAGTDSVPAREEADGGAPGDTVPADPTDTLRADPTDTLRVDVAGAVRRAVTASENVLMARAEKARAAGIVREVRASSLPQISASFGYTRNVQTPVLFFNTEQGVQQIRIGNDNEYTFGLNFSQTLFDFSLGPARSAARLSRAASDAQVEAARNDAALAARTAYYDVLLAVELVRVQRQALEQARRRLEQVRDFYEAGTAAEFDLLTARVEVDNLRPDLIDARNRLELARNRLKRRMGLDLGRTLVLTDSFPPPEPPEELSAYVRRALENRSDLQGQRIRVDLQRENLASQEKSAFPTLELVAGLQRRASSGDLLPPEQDFSQSATAGLRFSVPLFDGRSRSGRIQQAAAAVDRERYRMRQMRENTRLQVQQAYQELTAARQRIEASRATQDRAARALEIAHTRFRNGLATQVELNDAELAVTRARTNLARALHVHAVARARLMAAVGRR